MSKIMHIEGKTMSTEEFINSIDKVIITTDELHMAVRMTYNECVDYFVKHKEFALPSDVCREFLELVLLQCDFLFFDKQFPTGMSMDDYESFMVAMIDKLYECPEFMGDMDVVKVAEFIAKQASYEF